MNNPSATRSNREKASILIVDDDEQICELLQELLSPLYSCATVNSAEAALKLMTVASFDLVISDINMEGISGLVLIPELLKQFPDTVVVVISGQSKIDYAIEAMRAGAFDYITKPLDLRLVETAVARALTHHRLLVDKRRHESQLEDLIKERTAQVEHLAYFDPLTDLPNRHLFSDRCAQALANAQRHGHLVGVMLVSLDRFKKVTDTLGLAAGDLVLGEAAARLQRCISEGDTVARFDGDEFALLLNEVKETTDLTDMSLTISDVLKKEPFRLEGQDVYVTASIGISVFPFNGEETHMILRNAGAALYRAKRQGGNNYQFYAAEMNMQALRRLELETSLRRAIENKQFITHYQPVVNLFSGDVVGGEALVRWRHPEIGILPPANFIALAEDTGLILEIGESVMRAACTQTRVWQERGYSHLRVAANVSARQLRQETFPKRVQEILEQTDLDPSYLELEITETSIIENPEHSARLLAEIRDLGVRIAIDDFGTGYSSLSYLKSLPIDTLKLDRSFVQGATRDPDDAALVKAIVTLAHNLRLRVIAEGVETKEQVAFLRLLKCDEAQGFLFGRPMPPDVFEATLGALARQKLNVDSVTV